jgi:hypothetical protein
MLLLVTLVQPGVLAGVVSTGMGRRSLNVQEEQSEGLLAKFGWAPHKKP